MKKILTVYAENMLREYDANFYNAVSYDGVLSIVDERTNEKILSINANRWHAVEIREEED